MKTTQKTIAIVGATGGIGSVLARVFHAQGWNVALASRTKEKLDALEQSLGAERTLVVPMDATNDEDAQKLFRLTKEKWGKVDAVVIAAGTWKRLSLRDSVKDARALADAHYKGIYLPSYIVGIVAAQFFLEQGDGLIANISSHAAIRHELLGNVSYTPMKSASRSLMLVLRNELTEFVGTNVRVTDIEPAIVNTPDARALLDTKEKQEKAVQPEDIAQWIVDHIDDKDIPATQLFDSDLKLA